MRTRGVGLVVCLLIAVVSVDAAGAPAASDYSELVSFFHEWRRFAAPPIVDGVPDYSAEAMARQFRALPQWRARLEAIDDSEWAIPQRIDRRLVRAEIDGLDFDHRVRRPWANDPAFYVVMFPAQSDVPAHEGPVIHGWLDTWTYEYPLSPVDAAAITTSLRVIPPLLERARENLTGPGADLWRMGIGSLRGQSNDLAAFGERVAGTSADLADAVAAAIDATDRFVEWLEAELVFKNGWSGVGKDNYTWHLQNVELIPYTWEQELALMERELWRAHAALRLEENRNRHLPELERFSSSAHYDAALAAAVSEYMEFLAEEEIVSLRDWMAPALLERVGRFSEPQRADGLRGFFSEVQYRDGLVMRTHGYHWFDLARMENEPHESPIRRIPALFNVYAGRSEGMATGVEEMFMHAGLFDERPRARELVWILLAQRAARAIGGLMMHGNEWTMQQAVDFASEWTPRGWLPADGGTVWGEQHLYLRQPGYGTSYLIGKIQIEQLLAERANQLGEDFSLRRFFDEIDATGIIPVTMARWEMTGKTEPAVERR